MKSQPTRTGLTLVELLVVIAVILMLTALLLPAVMRSRDSSRKVACANNLKQLANAVHQFHGRQGSLPSYWGSMSGKGGHYGGWFLHLLPDMDKQTLYDSFTPPESTYRWVENTVKLSDEIPASTNPPYSPGYYERVPEIYFYQAPSGHTVTGTVSKTRLVPTGGVIKKTVTEKIVTGTTSVPVYERGITGYKPGMVPTEVEDGEDEVPFDVVTTSTNRETVTVRVSKGYKPVFTDVGVFTYVEEFADEDVEQDVVTSSTTTEYRKVKRYKTVLVPGNEPVWGDVLKGYRDEPVYSLRDREVEEPEYREESYIDYVPIPEMVTVTGTYYREKFTNGIGTEPKPAEWGSEWTAIKSGDPVGLHPQFGPNQHDKSFPELLCGSDVSSTNMVTLVSPTLTGTTTGTTNCNWALTNYQANAHAFVKFGEIVVTASGTFIRALSTTGVETAVNVSGTAFRGPGGRILNPAVGATLGTTTAGGATPVQELHTGGRFPRPDRSSGGATSRTFAPFNVLLTGTVANGLCARRFDHMLDGQSNTILFGEGMRQCNGGKISRAAFLPAGNEGHEHAFGIEPTQHDPSTGQPRANIGGFGNTLMFQVRPGVAGCNKLRLQANHEDVLNVAMADGSVRGISSQVSRRELFDPDVNGRSMNAQFSGAHPAGLGGRLPRDANDVFYRDGVWDMLMMPSDGADGNVLANTGEIGREK